ncbi:MAG: hypothetical protein ABJA11_11615, partial [Pseudolysinimonas sp.]
MPSVIHPARWSLQRRMVVGIVVLLAVVSVVVGGASALVLRQNLLTRLDQQVATSARFSGGGSQDSGTPSTPTGDDIRPPRFGGLFFAWADGQAVVAEAVGEDGVSVALTPSQQKLLLALSGPDRTPVSVDLGGSLGAYRVATSTRFEGTRVVVGQSLAEVNTTTVSRFGSEVISR